MNQEILYRIPLCFKLENNNKNIKHMAEFSFFYVSSSRKQGITCVDTNLWTYL